MITRTVAPAKGSATGRQRLHNLWITAPRGEPHEVVRHLGALQAQDYQSALAAIALRARGGTVREVERAVRDRRIVRTWPMRGTLHIVPAEDVRWMLSLTAPNAIAKAAKRSQALGVDAKVLAQCERLLAPMLAERVQLTRDEALSLLDRGGIATASQRGYHLLLQLAMRGVLCFGAPEGKQPTFALLDVWAPAQRELAADEALATLAARYLQSRSPATPHDFAYWSGLKVSEARTGFAAAAELRGEAAPAPEGGTPSAHLLPAFDEYLLGYKDRSAVLASDFAGRVVPGKNGVFLPTLVYDGQVVGTFRRSASKSRMRIAFEPFAPLTRAAQTALARAVLRYGALYELPAELIRADASPVLAASAATPRSRTRAGPTRRAARPPRRADPGARD